MRSKPKCEDIGFDHCWKDATSSMILAVCPPQSNSKQRICVNCGLHQIERIKQPEIREWEKVEPNNT